MGIFAETELERTYRCVPSDERLESDAAKRNGTAYAGEARPVARSGRRSERLSGRVEPNVRDDIPEMPVGLVAALELYNRVRRIRKLQCLDSSTLARRLENMCMLDLASGSWRSWTVSSTGKNPWTSSLTAGKRREAMERLTECCEDLDELVDHHRFLFWLAGYLAQQNAELRAKVKRLSDERRMQDDLLEKLT